MVWDRGTPPTRSGLARSGRGFCAHTKPNQEATKACSPFKSSKFDVNFVEFEHFETFNFELLNAQFWRSLNLAMYSPL